MGIFRRILAILLVFGFSSTSFAGDHYSIDNTHSSMIFRVKHQNIAYFYGRFNDLKGTFLLDDAKPANSVVRVVVKAKSIDTDDKKRDKHLKSPDFFDVKQFPAIEFESTRVTKIADMEHMFQVTGDLTLHGVTKEVTAMVEHTGSGKGRGGKDIAGFEAILVVNRTDFGMTYGKGALGEEVRITLSAEGAK